MFLINDDDAKFGKGVNNADLGPIMTSKSPRFARSNWSDRSPGDILEFRIDTRSPK